MNKEWLSRKDLAEWLNVSMSTIVRVTTMPDFPTPIRVSGSLHYNSREVERWIKTKREPQPPEFGGVPRSRSRRGRRGDAGSYSGIRFRNSCLP